MERKYFLKAFLLASLVPAVLLSSCKEEDKKQDAQKQHTYTCSMHPQIVQLKPGTCPICGMDLVPFDKNNTDASLTLSESQMALANVTTMTIGNNTLSAYKQLNGRLATDPSQTAFISSRVEGRIETLYIKETGIRVSKGQPLYTIYSEELASLQQEYLVAAAQSAVFPDDQRFQQIQKAAKQKLILYDQSEQQMKSLLDAKKTSPYVTYAATVNGTVAELSVTEGQYIAAGGSVMRIESYDQLWVEADIYPGEASLVKTGQSVKVIIPGWEDQPQQMVIRFINPSLQTGSQLLQIRGTIANPDRTWQAGLQASILLPVQSKGNVLTLPVDAVIRDGKGAHVWVEILKGKFEPRMVKTGMENADAIEVTEGIKEGETVVVTGAYLLYSEYVLKKGADPMAGHNH